jgi:4-diphosphocytidyl-2-C-methyl-D-erythritol kinase
MDETRHPAGIGLSPAKVNLGLHILGKRADGFHDIDTIMQAITLFDRIAVYANGSGTISSTDSALDGESNLIARAARELAQRCGKEVDVDFHLDKRIPAAAGLGGGSSNAATAIHLLARHWNLDPDEPAVYQAAIATGSDVPFFLRGGTARATGRGEILEPLPAPRAMWFVVVVPSMVIEGKTARLYSALTPEDFSFPSGAHLDLHNAFERPLYDNFPSARAVPEALRSLTTAPVALSGAGPAHFAEMPDLRTATELLVSAHRDARLAGCRIHLARSMPGAAPIAMIRNEPGG